MKRTNIAAPEFEFDPDDPDGLRAGLAGRPTLRHAEGSEELDPWDVVRFPRGPEGAHGIGNQTEEPARILMFSTVIHPTATVYPDSGKVALWTGDPDADLIVRRESGVEYYDGEDGSRW